MLFYTYSHNLFYFSIVLYLRLMSSCRPIWRTIQMTGLLIFIIIIIDKVTAIIIVIGCFWNTVFVVLRCHIYCQPRLLWKFLAQERAWTRINIWRNASRPNLRGLLVEFPEQDTWAYVYHLEMCDEILKFESFINFVNFLKYFKTHFWKLSLKFCILINYNSPITRKNVTQV